MRMLDPQIKQQQLEKKRLGRLNALRHFGFVDVTDKLYYGTRTFNAKDYTTLISTYSDHKAMPEEIRIPFLKEIADIIDRCGGKFTLSDTMLLCMGSNHNHFNANKLTLQYKHNQKLSCLIIFVYCVR
ncbi:hypothetical protein [Paenibacillus antibioticophila]|uniref:hypothetical protein n=1 Tax=Paenibacillus antibioticophila TaxID=1274374 RepID=UPI0005C8245F|nr:hypothetical protein [Paenibacillus antibioticophila]